MIIDDTDNMDYFLYKFNIPNEQKKRIQLLKTYYLENKKKYYSTRKIMENFISK